MSAVAKSRYPRGERTPRAIELSSCCPPSAKTGLLAPPPTSSPAADLRTRIPSALARLTLSTTKVLEMSDAPASSASVAVDAPQPAPPNASGSASAPAPTSRLKMKLRAARRERVQRGAGAQGHPHTAHRTGGYAEGGGASMPSPIRNVMWKLLVAAWAAVAEGAVPGLGVAVVEAYAGDAGPRSALYEVLISAAGDGAPAIAAHVYETVSPDSDLQRIHSGEFCALHGGHFCNRTVAWADFGAPPGTEAVGAPCVRRRPAPAHPRRPCWCG